MIYYVVGGNHYYMTQYASPPSAPMDNSSSAVLLYKSKSIWFKLVFSVFRVEIYDCIFWFSFFWFRYEFLRSSLALRTSFERVFLIS